MAAGVLRAGGASWPSIDHVIVCARSAYEHRSTAAGLCRRRVCHRTDYLSLAVGVVFDSAFSSRSRPLDWLPLLRADGSAMGAHLPRRFHIARSPGCGSAEHRFDRHTAAPRLRSEEHTSELQSLMRTSYAVFCLK